MMSDLDYPGILRIIDNERIFNLETLVSDLKKNYGQGNVSFTQHETAVIISIKTDNLVELAEVYRKMSFTVSQERKG